VYVKHDALQRHGALEVIRKKDRASGAEAHKSLRTQAGRGGRVNHRKNLHWTSRAREHGSGLWSKKQYRAK